MWISSGPRPQGCAEVVRLGHCEGFFTKNRRKNRKGGGETQPTLIGGCRSEILSTSSNGPALPRRKGSAVNPIT